MLSRENFPGPTARSRYAWITSYRPKDATATLTSRSSARQTNFWKNSISATSSRTSRDATSSGFIFSVHECTDKIVKSKSQTTRRGGDDQVLSFRARCVINVSDELAHCSRNCYRRPNKCQRPKITLQIVNSDHLKVTFVRRYYINITFVTYTLLGTLVRRYSEFH